MNSLFSANSPDHSAPTLVLIFKRPKLGQGKQRLAASIGLDSACQLAEQFLNCALEDLQNWPGPVVLSPSTVEDKSWAQALLPSAEVVEQSDGNLGRRILELDRSLRAQGHRSMIYIGSDAPMLKPIHFETVAATLAQSHVVVCPASDGGVTMMASGEAWPLALEKLPWSTEQLGQSLIDSCEQIGLNVSSVLSSYDIDQQADLQQLKRDLIGDTRPQRQQLLSLIDQLKVLSPEDESSAGYAMGLI